MSSMYSCISLLEPELCHHSSVPRVTDNGKESCWLWTEKGKHSEFYPGNHTLLEMKEKQQPLSKNREKLDSNLTMRAPFPLFFFFN